MKTFKNVLKILMIVIFIISAAFNIMILGNTYGTLVFKYDEEKLLSMASTSTLNFMPTYFLTEVESGFQITKEVTENDKTDKNTYDFYFDKESNLTAKIYSSEQTGDSYKKNTSYYKDGTLFQDIDGVKSKVTSTPQSITNEILTELFTLQNGLVSDIEDTDNKSMVGFSLKPFYVIGIRYTVKADDRFITFDYDLDGDVRKITIKHKSGKVESYTINYKDSKISMPDLAQY